MPIISGSKKVTQPPTPLSRETFREWMKDEGIEKTYDSIRQLKKARKRGEITQEYFEKQKAELKRRNLPIVTPMASYGGDGTRNNKNAIPTGLFMMDYDHLDAPRAFYDRYVKGREDELHINLAHVTPSDEGLRLVACLLPGETIVQGQARMHRLLGCAEDYDPHVKDLARASFMFPESALLFYDEDLLFADSIEAELQKRGITLEQPAPCPPVDSPAGTVTVTGTETAQQQPVHQFPTAFKDMPFADIIDYWTELAGGEPVEGERHSFVMKLASELRCICENNPCWLRQVLPGFGLPEAEFNRITEDACKYPLPSCLPNRLYRALGDLQYKQPNTELPPLPERLPGLIALLTKNVPDHLKPVVACAVFPALATYPRQATFNYLDNTPMPLGLMCVVMGPSSEGKGSIRKPIEYIMERIRVRDEKARQTEQAWKEEVNTRGANKDKRKRPKVVVQWMSADMTASAFAQRLQDADGLPLFALMSEIQQLNALKSNTGKDGQFDIIRLAFDEDPWGQERSGMQSVTVKTPLRFNWTASTTITQGKQFFGRNLAGGALSRLNLCTIPAQDIGAPIPVFGTYDDQFAQRLRPYIDNLCVAQGAMECPEAFRLAEELDEECRHTAEERQSEAYDYFRKRAQVIAYRKACLLWLANGQKWEPEMDDFIRWSLHYDLACKMMFFGREMEYEMRQEKALVVPVRSRSPLLQKLPHEFTYDDAVNVRRQEGRPEKGTKVLLKQWVSRGYIERVTGDTYRKL